MQELQESQIELANEIATEEPIQEYIPENEIIPTEQLKLATVAVEELVGIYNTISQEGVSSHDLADIKNITDRLAKVGMVLPKRYSLESYSKLVTPQRTSLNLEISTESIIKTVLVTLKKWIQWLVEAVTKTIRWFKSVTKADTLALKRIEFYNNAAIRAKTSYEEMVKLNDTPSSEALEQIEQITRENLKDPSLRRNRATLTAFGEPQAVLDTKTQYLFLEKHTQDLLALTDRLITLVENHDTADVTKSLQLHYANTNDNIENTYKQLEDLFKDNTTESYFIVHKNVGMKFYEHFEKRILTREYFSYRTVYDNYVKCGDLLSKFRQVTNRLNPDKFDPDEFDKVQELLKAVSTQIDMVNKTVDLFNQLKSSYIKVSILHTNQFLQMAKILMNDYSPITDQQEANLRRIVKTLEVIFKDLGL